MTSRERFESFTRKSMSGLALNRINTPECLGHGDYMAPLTRQCWKAWQAAERDMLERCIEVLTRYNDCSDAYEEMKELLNEQH